MYKAYKLGDYLKLENLICKKMENWRQIRIQGYMGKVIFSTDFLMVNFFHLFSRFQAASTTSHSYMIY